MSEDSRAAALSPLDRHRLRRLRGIPTVTVLVGEPEVAEWVWERWQRSCGRVNVSAVGETDVALMCAWLDHEHVRGGVADRVRALVAGRLGLSTAECGARIAGQSSWQFGDLVASLVPVLGCSAKLLISALGRQAAPTAGSPVEDLALDFTWTAKQLGSDSPALLLRDPINCEVLSDSLARALVRTAEAAPHLDFGVVAGSTFSFTGSAAVQREAALLREGVLRVDGVSTEPKLAASTSNEAVLSFDHAEFARSRAERALYRQLELRPTTRGLFVLNGKLAERFGSGALEVDLLSEHLCVALEVDGYHHFRDSTAYRRDRKKDLLLQELGYLVVRVLASDITDETEHVLELIDRAVARRSERRA